MWYGWLSGAATLSFLTLLLAAERLEGRVSAWWHVFIPTYLLLGYVLAYAATPLCDARRGLRAATPPPGAVSWSARSAGLVTNFIVIGLLLASAILFPVRYDSGPPAPAPGAPSLAAVVVPAAVALGLLALALLASQAVAPWWGALAGCCYVTRGPDEGTLEAPPPCLGGAGVYGSVGRGWNSGGGRWRLALQLLGIVVLLLCGVVALALVATDGGVSTAHALIPVYVGAGLSLAASLGLLADPLGRGLLLVLLWDFDLVMLIVWASLVPHAAAIDSPHVCFTPLYIALALSAIVLCGAETCGCGGAGGGRAAEGLLESQGEAGGGDAPQRAPSPADGGGGGEGLAAAASSLAEGGVAWKDL